MKQTSTDRAKGGRFLPALCNILGTVILLAVILTYLPLSMPRYMGYEVYSVVSPSMEPAIPEGSVVYVEPTRPELLEVGDVVAYHTGTSVVTHRITVNQRVVGELTTKGDANEEEDPVKVGYTMVIGKVTRHIPYIGSLMAVYASPIGKAYALVFAACGLMFNLLASRMRARKREKLLRRMLEEQERGRL